MTTDEVMRCLSERRLARLFLPGDAAPSASAGWADKSAQRAAVELLATCFVVHAEYQPDPNGIVYWVARSDFDRVPDSERPPMRYIVVEREQDDRDPHAIRVKRFLLAAPT